MLREALIAGCEMFQLRDKTASDREIAGLCGELDSLCREFGALFVLNDRVELALKLGVSGLHIGENDERGGFSEIRRAFRGVLGVSCYGDVGRAVACEAAGADYVAFGSIFKSSTKSSAKVVGTGVLAEARARLKIPICAIGGINAQNIATLQNADYAAIVAGIWQGRVGENVGRLREVCGAL